MPTASHRTLAVAALASALVACVATLSIPAHAASDSPLVVLDMQTDPHKPVVATMKMGSHSYRMALDTGATNLVLHLPVAQRFLTPAPVDSSRPKKANGLFGEVEFQFFKGEPFTLGHWTSPIDDDVTAIDMGQVANEEGIDGVLGVRYLAKLNWHWDNRQHRVSGYADGAPTVAKLRSRLHCEPLKDVDGDPGLVITIGNEQTLFVIDTGDLSISGGLNPQDRAALEARGAVRLSGVMEPQVDIDGQVRVGTRATQIQHMALGPTRLDGLILREISGTSRLGRGFLSKFDEVLFDFESGHFCYPAVPGIEADDPVVWFKPGVIRTPDNSAVPAALTP